MYVLFDYGGGGGSVPPKIKTEPFLPCKNLQQTWLAPSGHEFHHLCWPQDLVPLPVTRVLRFWKPGGGVILLLRLSPHLICGIVLCQNGHDGPQFHPPLRFRWSPVKERWSLVIRHHRLMWIVGTWVRSWWCSWCPQQVGTCRLSSSFPITLPCFHPLHEQFLARDCVRTFLKDIIVWFAVLGAHQMLLQEI